MSCWCDGEDPGCEMCKTWFKTERERMSARRRGANWLRTMADELESRVLKWESETGEVADAPPYGGP
jgi:hypothetical protein